MPQDINFNELPIVLQKTYHRQKDSLNITRIVKYTDWHYRVYIGNAFDNWETLNRRDWVYAVGWC